MGTRSCGWMRPTPKTLREAGSDSETTVSGTALIVDAPQAVGPRKIQRAVVRKRLVRTFLRQHELDQVRGSPCRAVPAPLASQPLAGAPLVSAGGNIVHEVRGVKQKHLGRGRGGKNCNREGNLCKSIKKGGPAARWPPAVPGPHKGALGPRFAVRVAPASSMARLPTFAAGFSGELRILREAALLIR